MKKLSFFTIALSLAAVLAGCVKEEGPAGGGATDNGTFDFSLTQIYGLDLNLNLKGYQSPVIFEVYAQNPYLADGITRNADVEPILQRFALTADGKFQGDLVAPVGLEKVYLHSSYPGIPRLVEVPVTGNKVTLDLSKATSVSKFASRAPYSYPAGFEVLGDWAASGRPDYLLNPAPGVPVGLMDYINGVLPDEQSVLSHHPELLTDTYKTLRIREEATVNMVFVHNGGMFKNAVGYYTFPTGSTPTLENIKKVIVFPNAKYNGDGGGLNSGDGVALKYYNASAKKWEDKFPAGTTIGFFHIMNGFDAGSIGAAATFYSNYDLVAGQMQQAVAFYSDDYKMAVLGFEDQDRNNVACDHDFNDIIMYVKSTPDRAIDPTDPPKPADPPTETATRYFGTLIYEDLWPNRGDYDLNDLVVEYSCYVYQNAAGKVTRIKDKYTAVHNGAQIQSGFAVQYGFAPGEGRVTRYETDCPFPVGENVGKNYQQIPFETGGGYFELGQAKANIMFFDDIRSVKRGTPNYTWKFEVAFDTPLDIAYVTYPPYNPYSIIKHAPVEPEDKLRVRELHLASTTWYGSTGREHKLYPPTDKASYEWFGTAWDHSKVAEGIFYLSNDNYPFALNIPYQHGWKLADEGYSDKDLDKSKSIFEKLYPEYNRWATSHGYNNKSWYLHPSK